MRNIWHLARKKSSFRWAARFLFVVGFVAVFSPFIASEQPLLVYNQHGLQSPVIKNLLNNTTGLFDNTDWKSQNNELVIYPLIPWTAGKGDYANADYKSPFAQQILLDNQSKEISMPLRFRHWFGTDLRGADVLAGMINGAGVSIRIGFIAALLAFLLGLLIGGAAGWLKEFGLQLSLGFCFAMLIFLIFVIQLFCTSSYLMISSLLIKFIIIIISLFIFVKVGRSLSYFYFFSKKIKIPFDVFVLRLIEIVSSFPKIVLILVFAGFFKASIGLLISLLVFTGWPDFARIIRSEFIRLSKFNYIEAARQIGASDRRIILRHILPNAIVPVLVTFVYAIASYMLIEAGLSFLGIGVPPTEVTWGSLMASGKENLNAWWLILFPGMMLTLTIASFHTVAEGIQKQLTK